MPPAQVAEAAMARAFSMAPILIHPQHLSPSLPIGERRMGGVRTRPISSQMGTSNPALPTGAAMPASRELHACPAPLRMPPQPRPRLGFEVAPPASPDPTASPSYLPLGARRKKKK